MEIRISYDEDVSHSINAGSQHLSSPQLLKSETSSQTASPTSENGLEVLGRGSRRLLQAIEELRVLGIEELGLSLPKICVVGDQSVFLFTPQS